MSTQTDPLPSGPLFSVFRAKVFPKPMSRKLPRTQALGLLLGLACGTTALLGSAAAQEEVVPSVQGDVQAVQPATATPPKQLISYSTITVQRGDTAYALAREFGLTVPDLLALNGLVTHNLEVGQTLKVAEIPPYQVAKGDTLYSLARTHGVTLEALRAANNLSEDATAIEIGQWLAIPAAPQPRPMPAEVLAASQPASPAFSVASESGSSLAQSLGESPSNAAQQPGSNSAWRTNALAMLNTPYVYGGNSPTGVDCSSFVMRVFQPLGVKLPRTSAQQAQVGRPVARAALRGGDLVFFDTVGRGSVTHVGIYLGDDQFVNANSYYGRVVIDRLDSDRYWSPRYLSARRVLDGGLTAVEHSLGQPLALGASFGAD